MSVMLVITCNAGGRALANVFLCTLPAMVIIFLPMMVGGMIDQYGFSPQQAGYVVTLDMLGYTIGTLSAYLYIHRCNWRSLALVCLLLMLVTNGASIWIDEYEALLAIRFLSGVGGGVLTAVTFAAIGQMRDPDSAYGWWLVFQSAAGVIGFQINDMIGIRGGFGALALLTLISLPLLMCVPVKARKRISEDRAMSPGLFGKALAGVAAIFLIYIGLMMMYTYLERIGIEGGMLPADIAWAFTAMSVAGLLGGLLAAKLGSRYGRLIPATIGSLGCVLSFYLLAEQPFQLTRFIVGCCLYFGLWSYLLPLLVGMCASVDASGRLLSLANAAIGAGLAGGPFMAAQLVGESNFSALTEVASVFMVGGLMLMLPLLRVEMPSPRHAGSSTR